VNEHTFDRVARGLEAARETMLAKEKVAVDAPAAGCRGWPSRIICGTSRRGRFLIKRKFKRDRMRAKLRAKH
jgi:hypothetical protein